VRRKFRLREERRIREILRRGRGVGDSSLLIKSLPNEVGFNRFCFIVGKSVGKAVVRNRIRRLLREIARELPLKKGYDFVVMAREEAAGRDYGDLKEVFRELAKKGGFLEEA